MMEAGEKLVAIKLKELASPRTATSVQGWVLVSNAWLAVMASAVIAPVLPRMAAHFQNTPHAPLMISLVATLPALFIALLAAPFGLLADRVGRRLLLLIGLAVYGVLGVAPYWLNSLQWIVASRAGVGVTEAMITTCSTALIGDYFYGDIRERWFALQTGSLPLWPSQWLSSVGSWGSVDGRCPSVPMRLASSYFLSFFSSYGTQVAQVWPLPGWRS